MYVRKIEDRVLTFIVSGMLWRNSLVMQDLETGSYWSHITGEVLWGEIKKQKLSILPVVQTSWKLWKTDYPDTRVLKKSQAVRSSAYEEYFQDKNRAGLFRTEWLKEQLPAKEIVHGIILGPHALAIHHKKLKEYELIQTSAGGESVLVFRAKNGGVLAFRITISDRKLTFPSKIEGNIISDNETSSTWNLKTGECIDGPLAGRKLSKLQVMDMFWFAWSSFYPNTKLIK